MITRIVKMVFAPQKAADFDAFVRTIVDKIGAMPGCRKVYVLRDIDRPNVFFTYSYWDSTEDLENYRNSELFKEVWSKTKTMFEQRAEAWSTEIITESKEKNND